MAAYLAAFRHISTVVRNTGANVRIQQAYNSWTYTNDQSIGMFQSMYVGDAYCDEVVTSAYNFAGLSVWSIQTISMIITPWYNAMLGVSSKRLGIAEMSSTAYLGNNKGDWFRQMWNSLAWQFPRIQTINLFLQNDWKKGEDLDINDDNSKWGLKDGYYGFRTATGWKSGDQPVVEPTPDQIDATQAAADAYEQSIKDAGIVYPDVNKHAEQQPTATMTTETTAPTMDSGAKIDDSKLNVIPP